MTILDKDSKAIPTGASFRTKRSGPEHSLVETFLEHFLIKTPRGHQVTIFREPKIESGFPDLVIVVWHVATAEKWLPIREHLSNTDIRIMNFIANGEGVSHEKLREIFGVKIKNSLEILSESGMIKCKNNRWSTYPLSKVFAARQIIAIEAKMSEWQVALDQAYLNTWFASASYIMIPQMPKTDKLRDKAISLGVGVHEVSARRLEVNDALSHGLPRSYASWQFNEWAWRAAKL